MRSGGVDDHISADFSAAAGKNAVNTIRITYQVNSLVMDIRNAQLTGLAPKRL